MFNKLQTILRPYGLRSFLNKYRLSENVLDVGCGNGSSIFIKSLLKKSHLWGIDVANYNQSELSLSLYDEYKIFSPDSFHFDISNLKEEFDLIISSHNIEHCNSPESVFKAMVGKLKKGGRLFLVTPSVNSVNFPSRSGTLNFYDDITHKKPVDLLALANSSTISLEVLHYSKSTKPFFWRLIGFFNEKKSNKQKKVCLGTWDYWGFEQIIWLQRL